VSDPESLFKAWIAEHGGAVLKVARAYTLTAEDCRDLVQEILLQVWRSLPGFRARASPATWIYRIALNTALGWHRKERVRLGRERPIYEEIPAPTGQIERREAVERLYAAIRRLPPPDAALILLYLDGLSYRQIAEVLGTSEGNVGVKLNRVKKALGELMREVPHGP
jgi:RNA polymerase sigma-70 factor (ECF subfamily)